MTKQLDEMKGKLSSLRPINERAKPAQGSGKSKRSKNSNKKYADSDDHSSQNSQHKAPVEERFRLLLQEVNDRVRDVHLKKDDYELYVKNQHEIDDFFVEAVTEITAIKRRLKQRFESIQRGTGVFSASKRQLRGRGRATSNPKIPRGEASKKE